MDQPIYLLYLFSICGLLMSLYLLAQGKSAQQAFITAAVSAMLALFAPVVVADVKNANIVFLCMIAGAATGLLFLLQKKPTEKQIEKQTERQIAFALSLTPLGFATTTIALALCLHEGVRNTLNSQGLNDAIERLALATTIWAGGITLTGAPIAAWKIKKRRKQLDTEDGDAKQDEGKTRQGNSINQQANRFIWGASSIITIVVIFMPIFILFPIIAILALASGGAVVSAMQSKKEQAMLPALFNIFGGIAACALGFVLAASVLIVAGAILASAGVGFSRNVCIEQKMMLRQYTAAIFGRKR